MTKLSRADYLCLLLAPMLFGCMSALLPLDANFDLANYHFYNPWALLHHRHGRDLLASNLQSFFNPLLDLPFYLGSQYLPGRVVAFFLGMVHSVSFLALYFLGRVLLYRQNGWRDSLVAAFLAGAGVLAAISVSELGTTYYDYVGAAGALACMALLARTQMAAPTQARLAMVGLAGLVLGAVVGLKLTNIFLAAGIGCALPLLGVNFRQRIILTAVFAVGGMAGFLITGGPWMWYMWINYHNPVFPFFNRVFNSPWAPQVDLHDLRFMPRGWLETLFYPFIFTFQPQRVAEVAMRDFRFLALFIAVPFGAVIALFATARARASIDVTRATQHRFLCFLLLATALSYALWLALFSIRRYALPLEMLAPLLIALIVAQLPFKRAHLAVSLGFALLLIVTTQPKTWGRSDWRSWSASAIEVHVPPHEFDDDVILMLGWRPKSFVAPFFPEKVSFVRVTGERWDNLALQKFSSDVDQRIRTHPGRFWALVHSGQLSALDDLKAWNLASAPSMCDPLHTTLDLQGPLMLCRVERKPVAIQ